MSFVVEDGSGKSTATSYVTESYADAFFLDIGFADWGTKSSSDKQVLLIKATAYVDAFYSFKGKKTDQDNALQFPRIGATDSDDRSVPSDEIPTELKRAVCEVAKILDSTDLFSVQTKSVIEQRVEGAVSVKYDPNSPDHTRVIYVDFLLSGLVGSGSMNSELIRA